MELCCELTISHTEHSVVSAKHTVLGLFVLHISSVHTISISDFFTQPSVVNILIT